jgi:hypothetical protein
MNKFIIILISFNIFCYYLISASYNNIDFSNEYFDNHLNNKNIFMIGDSLTRYQYISLVYSLKYNAYLNNSKTPNPVSLKLFINIYIYSFILL